MRSVVVNPANKFYFFHSGKGGQFKSTIVIGAFYLLAASSACSAQHLQGVEPFDGLVVNTHIPVSDDFISVIKTKNSNHHMDQMKKISVPDVIAIQRDSPINMPDSNVVSLSGSPVNNFQKNVAQGVLKYPDAYSVINMNTDVTTDDHSAVSLLEKKFIGLRRKG